MRYIWFLAIMLIGAFRSFSQIESCNQAVIWRGFQHQWTYNHRCNRIGDYVQFNHGSPSSVHTSATGVGPDSTYYTSSYSLVTTPSGVFKEGVTHLKIEGREKRLNEQTIMVSVSANDWLKNKGDYITLINGFDLYSERAADKIQLLRFAIEDGEYASATNEIRFKINVSLVFNCQSVECPEFSNKVDYNLDIYYLIIGVNDNQIASTEKFYSRSYSWDKNEESNELPQEKYIRGKGQGMYTNAALGIKSFSIVLNEAHWLVDVSNNITPVSYDFKSGEMHMTMDLLIKEWQEGMKGSDAAPMKSKFAAKKKGWVVMDVGVVLLQFQDATIAHRKNSGAMFWKGTNEKPEGKSAKASYLIPYD